MFDERSIPPETESPDWRNEVRIILAAVAGLDLGLWHGKPIANKATIADIRFGLTITIRDALGDDPESIHDQPDARRILAVEIADVGEFDPPSYIRAVLESHGVDWRDPIVQESVMAQVDYVINRLFVR